jgi:hypothetical protein
MDRVAAVHQQYSELKQPTQGSTAIQTALPQLATTRGVGGALANAASLLLFGLFGAVLVHLAAFHLWPNHAAMYLLQHCPWRPVLLIVSVVGLVNGALFWRELRCLVHEHRDLVRWFGRDHVITRSTFLPRSKWRLASFFLCLFLIELGATALAMCVAPMQMSMLLQGHQVSMAIAPIFPLPLGQAIVAVVLAWLLWRYEHQVRVLRRVVAALRQRVAGNASSLCVPLPKAVPALPRRLHGFRIFSRPPPARSRPPQCRMPGRLR